MVFDKDVKTEKPDIVDEETNVEEVILKHCHVLWLVRNNSK